MDNDNGYSQMNHRIETVTFTNRQGALLFGVFQRPENPRPDIAVIFLSPGIKNRVGPHRLYVKMADRFLRSGFPILRVDPEGLGDSEGEIDQALTADVYASIQLGRYIEDTISMMDWAERQMGVKRLILAGLCGGAITALLAAERDDRVRAILALGIPCTLDSSGVDPARYITSQQLGSIRQKYIAKLLNPEAWLRLLSFKSDYKLLLRSLLQPLKKRLKAKPSEAPRRDGAAPAPPNSNLNPHFHRTFSNFIARRKMLLLFSGADRLYWEFEEKYLSLYQAAIEPYAHNYRIEIVPDANHVFSFTEWQEKMLAISDGWLEEISR
jgi:pimeloyl-ACP methyl ester carboxylesterase